MNLRKKIILGNAPSSGSSLLVSLLGSHPDIYQTTEQNIFDKPDWIANREKNLKNEWPAFTKKLYDLHFPYEHAALFNSFAIKPDFRQSSYDYLDFAIDEFERRASEHGRSIFVEKTPNNIFSIPAMHARRDDLYFIIIIRHPVSVYHSLRKRSYDHFTSVARWYFANLVALGMAERDRVLLTHYEELTARPDNELGRIFAFLGLEAPGREVFENRAASEVVNVPTWANDVRGAVVERPVNRRLPNEMVDIFLRLRANAYFFEYVGLEKTDLSPAELAKALGYDVVFPYQERCKPMRAFRGPNYLRYLTSSFKHGRRLRPAWHEWK